MHDQYLIENNMKKHTLILGLFLVLSWGSVTSNPDKKTSNSDNFPSDIFHNKTIITDHHHLEEELKHEIGDINLDEVSEEELEFYYFTVHDFDHNKLLDGLEIMAALQDSLEHHMGTVFTKEESMKHYIEMTDEVLQEDDLDKDGFLTYAEYMHSQKRTASPTTILDKNAKDKKGTKKTT
ncbi:multiple coagulation factor deficiency protein 2 homolog [Bombina bombina]|uniref:multiple coagulation factor deficiency protein 2 homolog n=1 Tax=Bombina bombina TaxID=8345 RepID=UPI00235A644B|nr:multiple coagulation factor deficiency protein 2 homolog [Bombina bombina]